MHPKTIIGAIGVAFLSLLLYSPICRSLTGLFILTIFAFAIGGCLVAWVHILLSSQHKTGIGEEPVRKEIEQFRNKLMIEFENVISPTTPQDHLPIILGRTLDGLLQQLIDYILRDFVSCYLNQYAYQSNLLIANINPGNSQKLSFCIQFCHLKYIKDSQSRYKSLISFEKALKEYKEALIKLTSVVSNNREDIWGGMQVLHDRFSRLDHAKIIACDLVTKITNHFEKIREAQSIASEIFKPNQFKPGFKLSPHLSSKENELEYLRNLSEILIMLLLPRSYSLSPAKYFLREVLACKVLQPGIDNITDPDCFNRNVIVYIEGQKAIATIQGNTFKSANSFEEYLKIIQKSEDLELLKKFRYDIVTKIMQATTLQNIKRAKGVDLDANKPSGTSGGISKSEINAAKKLKRYIDQLMYAKKECEKRLTDLGWNIDYNVKNILPLPSILDSMLGRRYLSNYLETVSSQGLVGYWTAVEELRSAPRKNWHQLGAEIFYTYIRNPSAEIKVDKNTRKRVEAFLLGDKGPEVFYEIQNQVVNTLEEKYYQPFINSDFYTNMLRAIDQQNNETEVDASSEDRQLSSELSSSLDNGLHVGDHSNYAKKKLDQLQEKLNNKNQALQALRSSLKPESRVLMILENEVEWLEGEQRQLEAHLSRTETWGENLGKWRAVVQSAEVPNEKEPPLFVIVVDMIEAAEADEEISSGWVVSRNLTQFQELHRKLRPLCSDIKSLELPSQSFKFLFGKTDKNSLEKAKAQIQKYLEFILEDDRLNQSEAIYSFLSPSSEHLKQSIPSPKKVKFSFSTLFKSSSGSSEGSKDIASILRESEDEDISQCLDSTGNTDTIDLMKLNGHSKLMEDKDTIAEPLYSLLSEIFDMRGVFKYLRKTLIAFVQVTYGRTINRQIYDTISWYLSEQMLYYYINMFMKSWWPGGELANPPAQRSAEEKASTADKAREQFIGNVPEVLVTLVGTNAARNGARKIFDTLQNKQMNKQLFYELLEVVLSEVFPELESKETF